MKEVLDDSVAFVISEDISIEKNIAVFPFKNTTVEIVSQRVNDLLTEKGYKLESGSLNNGTYGKGSMVLRVLFGAFVKRFCWIIRVEKIEDFAQLTLIKEAKGYVGGVIGVNQVNNEYKRLTDAFTDLYRKLKN